MFQFFPQDVFQPFDDFYPWLVRSRNSANRAEGLPASSVSSIRGRTASGFPAVNIQASNDAVLVQVFAPGLDLETVDLHLERGVLSVSGQRQADVSETLTAGDVQGGGRASTKLTRHRQERFGGKFTRVISLPDDVDAQDVSARYLDGVLHVRIARRQPAQARHIQIS